MREATADDLARLGEIQIRALSEPWPALLSTAVDGPPPVFVVEAPQAAGSSRPVSSTPPVGYALVVPGGSVAYIAELAVHPERQGEGLGSRLLSAVLASLAARGFDTVRLTVRADDERARTFYRNFEFTVIERIPDHYEDCDGLLLERPVGQDQPSPT